MIMTKSKCRNEALLAVACTLATGVGCAVPPTGNGESGGTNNVPDTIPNFDAAIFTSPTRIDNTFFPQIPGTTRTYQAETEDGTTYSCLQTRDFTALEPEVSEYKYYAPGVGVVLEETVHDGERVELIDLKTE